MGLALVAGCDLDVMLLSLFVPAEGFSDPTETVVQGVEVCLVDVLELLQCIAIVLVGQFRGAVGLEAEAG